MSQGPNNRLAIPGQLKINCQQIPGPNAHPITTAVPTQDGIQLFAFGGLSKLEFLAGQVVGGVDATDEELNIEELANISVSIAQAILDECEKRTSQQANPS